MTRSLSLLILTLWMGISLPASPLAVWFIPAGRVGAVAVQTATPQVIMSVQTATPLADGRLIHVVQPGQTLIMIANAYGVSLNDLYTLNNLSGDNPMIKAGQKLIVRIGPTATISPTPTETPVPATLEPSSTFTPAQPRATRTPTITASPTARPPLVTSLLGRVNTHTYGMGIIILCSLGLLIVLFSSFRKKS